MSYQVILLALLASVVSGQDCDTDGPHLGDACTTSADCNTGACQIVHSKCNADSVCECSLGYWGEVATRVCAQYELGEACTDGTEACQSTVPNADCDASVCGCAAGYYTVTDRLLQSYCLPISEQAPCPPGADGDTFCAAGDVNGDMTCSSVTSTCACPDGNQLIAEDRTCFPKSEDPSCASCLNSGGRCYLNAASEVSCACPSTKYSSTGDALTTGCDRGSAAVGGICQEDETVTCADPNAECVHFGTMTKRYVCTCKTGYISGPAWGDLEELVCHEELSSRQDANCAECNVNDGKCYDIDDDNVHDACKCPTSRSTSDPDDYSTYCDTLHVNVTCDSDSMTVCYMPHDTTEFPDIQNALETKQSIIFIKDKIKDQNCYLTDTPSSGWCIDLVYGTFLSCDTAKNDLNENTVSYTNWVILQRQPEKRTVNDMYMYVYCSYDSLVNAFTGHVAVEIGEPPAVAAEGDLVQAGVKLDILDQFGNDAGKSGVILGQQVQLVANLTEDKGVFIEIKAEVCLASNLPDLSSPFARTTLMMYDGCPELNNLLDESMVFTEDVGEPKVTRTNMFSMFKFDDSEYVFFHCALRVCMDGNVDECDASDCSARRKKRSALSEETGLEKRSMISDQKMASAMKKFDSPDFQVSVSAIKVKRDVNQIGFGADAPSSFGGFQPGMGRQVPNDQGFLSNHMVMLGGGAFGLLVLLVLIVVIVVVLKRPSAAPRRDVEAAV